MNDRRLSGYSLALAFILTGVLVYKYQLLGTIWEINFSHMVALILFIIGGIGLTAETIELSRDIKNKEE